MENANNLVIEQQKNIKIEGVTAVNSFSENNISLTLHNTKLYISGSGLKITDFSKEKEIFSATGTISSVKYSNSAVKFKLLK